MVGRVRKPKERAEAGGVAETSRARLLVGVKSRATGGDETLMPLGWAGGEAWPGSHFVGTVACDASERPWKGAAIAG